MIIVTPDANRVKNGYFDTKDWSYETFFFEEFIPYIETKYRISGIKSSRAVAGFSMGGGGAVVYAIKHPDMFSSVYAMSSLMSLPKPKERPAAMNPNPQSMEFGQSVLANDCIALIENIDQTRLEKLRKIKWFVDCGDDDFLLDVNTKFCRAMKEAKVPFELRIRDGDHNFEYWTSALYLALPFVSDGFKGK
ncbi:MAG: alpha/beta hydrolase-fold protein [Chitinophagaceae bacterium]|nr:alpha/beta hydrolase-fold protein [Chitinophagaceae bacterium]